jgi:hypothetical protein
MEKGTLTAMIQFLEKLFGRTLQAKEIDGLIQTMGMTKSYEQAIAVGKFVKAQEAIEKCGTCAEYYNMIIKSGTQPDTALLKFQNLIDGVVNKMSEEDKDKEKDKANLPPSEEDEVEKNKKADTTVDADDPHEEPLMPKGKETKTSKSVEALEKRMNGLEKTVVAMQSSISNIDAKIEKALTKSEDTPPPQVKEFTVEDAIKKLHQEGYSVGGSTVPSGATPEMLDEVAASIRKVKEGNDDRLTKGAKANMHVFGHKPKGE